MNGDNFVLTDLGSDALCQGCCCWRLVTSSDITRNGSNVTVDIIFYVCLVGSDYIGRVRLQFVGIGPFGTSPEIVYEHNFGTSKPDCIPMSITPAYVSTTLSPTSIASSSSAAVDDV